MVPDSHIPYTHDQLHALGPQRVYEGESLGQVAFPIGGIGTGSVSLSGTGALVDWEIFNRPNKGTILPFTFFCLWAQAEGLRGVTRVLEGPPQPPFDGTTRGPRQYFAGVGFGVPRETAAGLPHMRQARFRGEYPFAWVELADPALPLEVSLEAYNPFIPLNADDSSLPVAIFHFTLRNPGDRPVRATLAASLCNPIGYTHGRFDGRGLGGNVNSYVREGGLQGLLMTSTRYSPQEPQYGSLALVTCWPDLTWQSAWLRAGWFDSLQSFWDEFTATGQLGERSYGPSDEGKSDVGTIGLRVTLAPGESATLPIYLAWHFPNFQKYWHREGGPGSESVCCQKGTLPTWKNYYATRFQDALDVARYVAREEPRLRKESLRFHEALHRCTLPPYVIDALASQASILKTTTCVRLTDGTFYAFEGCHADAGCCEGSCTHVWNYAQTLAFLFPDLERSMRDADYAYNQHEDGHMGFRLQLPLGSPPSAFHAAADGQMGGILKVYRDWKLSGRTEWLRGLWPRVRKALAYAWKVWDVDRDGVMEGIQHNTYDIEFWGPNTMVGSFYLGALRAAEEMARALGEEEEAQEYRRLFESGRARMDAELFNGEYYEQRVDPQAHLVAPVDLSISMGGQTPGDPKYQYGSGCLSDQLIGQWLAHVVGLGYLFDPEHVRRAVESIFRHNWRPDLWEHANCQRVYALNDEAGLLLCTWPRGGRPAFPFPYSDEVWCGIEYQVASHLVYEGLVDEGLAIVRAARDRHDGVRRNPWNEMECGSHYARSLASWSLLTALSGFSFDLTRGTIGFAPRLAGAEFRTFWSVDTGWGTYSQRQEGDAIEALLRLEYGSLALRELAVGDDRAAGRYRQVQAWLNAASVPALLGDGPGARVVLGEGIALRPGDELRVRLGG
ncbi:MAG: GH116 family glycosyl-hydrolase [Anaerolineae bacterium]|nr:GH116 family glycosyl-hydrolase [Anaerolineae bacterium]